MDQGSRLKFDEDNEGNGSVRRVSSSYDEDQGSAQDEICEEKAYEGEPMIVILRWKVRERRNATTHGWSRS